MLLIWMDSVTHHAAAPLADASQTAQLLVPNRHEFPAAQHQLIDWQHREARLYHAVTLASFWQRRARVRFPG